MPSEASNSLESTVCGRKSQSPIFTASKMEFPTMVSLLLEVLATCLKYPNLYLDVKHCAIEFMTF